MTLSARVPSGADTYRYIPEIWLNLVIESAKSDLVAADAIWTEWFTDKKKGDTFYFPKSNSVTATEIVVGTKASPLNPFATAAVTVTMNQWYEAPVDIDYMTKFQSQAAMDKYAVTEARYAIDVAIDSYICSLFSSLGGYSTSAYGADGQDLSDDILRYLKETLDENNVPMNDRSLILDPSGLSDILAIDKLVSADYIKMKGAIENGIIGNSVYGCTVRVTNNLTAATTGAYGCMLHKKAISAGVQMDNAWKKEYEDLHQTRYQCEALWGASELQDTFGVPFYTRKK